MVIGGSGFLGRHIVQQLLDRGDNVSVFDIVQRYHDVPFYSGDITNEEQIASAFRTSGTTCIVHTASPPAGLKNAALYYKVNEEGTKTVIAAAVATGVHKLVFTSSAGVVFNGSDIIDIDERYPPPKVPMDAYNDSKAKAEALVLAANGRDGLLTVALRPAGIFGPGDRQLMSGLYQVYERGQTHFQIGDNTNLFDWTYVGNVARAHLLAADKLDTPPPATPLSQLEKFPVGTEELPQLTPAEQVLLHYPLRPITVSTGNNRVPTCEARPLGPYITLPPDAEKIEAAFKGPNDAYYKRPVVRTRFDAFSDVAIAKAKLYNPDTTPLQVAGQAFFITNGEPCYFWDFARAVWHHLDTYFPGHREPKAITVLPKTVGLAAAVGSEWYSWMVGKEPTFTKFKVTFSCTTRWHNIEKARRVLGYEPEVGLTEGVKRMVDWWYPEHVAGKHTEAH